MSPQHPTPGANAAAAAAPGVQEAGAPTPSTAPAEETPSPAAEPEAGSGTAPAGETTAAPPAAAAGTAEAPEEGIGVATAAGTAPGTGTVTGVDGGRPRKPVLAGAAIAGAALIAIPLLLIGSANNEGNNSAKRPVAEGADTVLNPNSAPVALDDYVAEKPSSSPSKRKPKKVETPKAIIPKAAVPMPVAPAPEPKTSSPPKKTSTPTPKPKPRATPKPKPNWTSVTVFAPSVLEVNQAWTTNRIRMVMQTDGNLVIHNEEGNAIWASMTFGPNHRAIFQPDGNLVIHNGDDRAIWASRTDEYGGAQLVLRADAKVAVVFNGSVVWST